MEVVNTYLPTYLTHSARFSLDSAPELPLPYVHKAKRHRDKTSNQVLLPLSYVPQGPRALNCYFPFPILRKDYKLSPSLRTKQRNTHSG